MKKIIRFSISLLWHLLSTNYRYARLTPFDKGRILFYDKLRKKIIKIFSRNQYDSITADQIYVHEEYDLSFMLRYEEIKGVYKEMVKKNYVPLIVDCGANIGLSARYFAENFPESYVIAIEPEVGNFNAMLKNCSGLSNISCRNFAVGSSSGIVAIDKESLDNRAFRTLLQSDGNSEGIDIVTINEIFNESKRFIPFIVKIDIEGFESDLFSKNTEWYTFTPIVVIETHDWMLPKEASARNFLTVASSENRDFLHRGENIFSISNDFTINSVDRFED